MIGTIISPSRSLSATCDRSRFGPPISPPRRSAPWQPVQLIPYNVFPRATTAASAGTRVCPGTNPPRPCPRPPAAGGGASCAKIQTAANTPNPQPFLKPSPSSTPQLSEQLRRKLRQIIPPIDPRVRARALLEHRLEAVLLQHLDGRLGGRHQPIVHARAEPQQLQTLLRRGQIQRVLVRLLPRRTRWRCRCRRGSRRSSSPAPPHRHDPQHARAVHPDVRELVQVRNRQVQRPRRAGPVSPGWSASAYGRMPVMNSCSTPPGCPIPPPPPRPPRPPNV